MQETLIKYGIPTYFLTIQTNMVGELTTKIASQMPTQIGRIYGMSLYSDTFTPDRKQLISINDATNMYLQLQWGSSYFINNIRLDSLIYDTIPFTTSLIPGARYFPCNVPGNFSLDQSVYINPLLVNNKTISLNLYYISVISYTNLVKKGIIEYLD